MSRLSRQDKRRSDLLSFYFHCGCAFRIFNGRHRYAPNRLSEPFLAVAQ